VYWALSTAGYVLFQVLGIIRIVSEGVTRLRLAIVAFATSWAALCTDNALFRLGCLEASSLSSWEAELIRAASVVTLWWMCIEFGIVPNWPKIKRFGRWMWSPRWWKWIPRLAARLWGLRPRRKDRHGLAVLHDRAG
jgi:hypothetical protein